MPELPASRPLALPSTIAPPLIRRAAAGALSTAAIAPAEARGFGWHGGGWHGGWGPGIGFGIAAGALTAGAIAASPYYYYGPGYGYYGPRYYAPRYAYYGPGYYRPYYRSYGYW